MTAPGDEPMLIARIDEAHVRSMVDLHEAGVPTVDYGNNIRQMAL